MNSFAMVNFRWPPELVIWLKEQAKANNKSVNAFGQEIVQQFRLHSATTLGDVGKSCVEARQ